MEFDKSKVFTPLNCKEVKIGSKGYTSNYYRCLKDYIEKGFPSLCFGILEDNDGEFQLKGYCGTSQFFYLVEEPKEKVKRPCTKDELVKMLKKQGILMLKCNLNDINYTMGKIGDKGCYIFDCGNYTYEELCEQFTLLDGTELWVEE